MKSKIRFVRHGAVRAMGMVRPSLAAVALAVTLAGCVVPPTSTVLSRLPEGQPGAAAAPGTVLTPAERKRYDAIDKQVLREQNEAIAADALARTYYYAPTPVYYGGYYGGWNSGWGAGYGYPGWGWGW
ncbi:hypothetical protein Bpla01_05940 [Burkholderia plantarii]|uniref:Lipoprotein n=2 Tax=Burkholderia plantarii TaxID=41899 RepID=A0A0B6RY44_BURPL|nr:hypothetical protein BGL_1c26050 [Burkholderia plantarii]ALK31303.1 putative lipoprotein [Burkholderia plantarii]GLZ17064.1 hypothetical protein Bpla01_05940 [Burkholderia plantarii]